MFHTKALWHTYNKNVVHAVVHPSDAPSMCTAVASCWASLSSTNSDDCGHRILDRVSWPRARHRQKANAPELSKKMQRWSNTSKQVRSEGKTRE